MVSKELVNHCELARLSRYFDSVLIKSNFDSHYFYHCFGFDFATGRPVPSFLFIAWTLHSFFGIALVELYMRGEMRRRKDEGQDNCTTAMLKKHPKDKQKKQRGEYCFPVIVPSGQRCQSFQVPNYFYTSVREQ